MGTGGGTGVIAPLLLEVGRAIMLHGLPVFHSLTISGSAMFLVLLVCRPVLKKRGMVEILLRSTKLCFAFGYVYLEVLENSWRRPWCGGLCVGLHTGGCVSVSVVYFPIRKCFIF